MTTGGDKEGDVVGSEVRVPSVGAEGTLVALQCWHLKP